MNDKSKLYKNIKDTPVGRKLENKEIHELLLEMTKALHDFCQEHNIRYCLAYGSMLGAVRHKGFIPWDDDVDIWMPRPDYNRFIKYSKISDRFSIVTYENDHGYYHPFPYCALTDENTVMIEKEMRCPTGKGQFIDIFPVDGIAKDKKVRKKQLRKLGIYARMKGIQSYKLSTLEVKSFKDVARYAANILLTPFDEMKLVEKIDKLAQAVPFESSDKFGVLYAGPVGRKCFYRRELIDNLTLADFEKYQFYISKDYDEALTIQYGDYMQLPPEEERVGQHNIELYYRENINY